MNKMLALIITILAVFAVVMQFDLMVANRTTPLTETVIRFFSFFTILTNTLVAFYFSYLTFVGFKHKKLPHNLALLTAITIYITIVGLVYQLVLRHTWNPTGMQKVVDEILHSVNPLLVIVYWYLNTKKEILSFRQIGKWLIYPLVYIIIILIRGHFSDFYPYPFLNVNQLGFNHVILNSLGMTLLFVLISLLFVQITVWIKKRGEHESNL